MVFSIYLCGRRQPGWTRCEPPGISMSMNDRLAAVSADESPAVAVWLRAGPRGGPYWPADLLAGLPCT